MGVAEVVVDAAHAVEGGGLAGLVAGCSEVLEGLFAGEEFLVEAGVGIWVVVRSCWLAAWMVDEGMIAEMRGNVTVSARGIVGGVAVRRDRSGTERASSRVVGLRLWCDRNARWMQAGA